MNCSGCGMNLPSDAKFCNNCGKVVSNNEVSETILSKNEKVKRVFWYSREVAKKNKNTLSIVKTVVIPIIILIIDLFFMIKSNFEVSKYTIAIFIMVFYACILIPFYSIDERLRANMVGFGILNSGRLFVVKSGNTGSEVALAGIATGNAISRKSDSKAADTASLAIGVASIIGKYAIMKKSAKYMETPEVVAKIIEQAPNVSDMEVEEILKVHSFKETKHSFKVNCDFKNIITGKIKYKNSLVFQKSYNQIDDLMNNFKGLIDTKVSK